MLGGACLVSWSSGAGPVAIAQSSIRQGRVDRLVDGCHRMSALSKLFAACRTTNFEIGALWRGHSRTVDYKTTIIKDHSVTNSVMGRRCAQSWRCFRVFNHLYAFGHPATPRQHLVGVVDTLAAMSAWPVGWSEGWDFELRIARRVRLGLGLEVVHGCCTPCPPAAHAVSGARLAAAQA